MTSKKITEILIEYFETDFTIDSRKRNLVYMRSLCNALCRKYTNESFDEIGKNYASSDHATILNSVKKFYDTYIHQTSPIDMLKCYQELEYIFENTKTPSFSKTREKDYQILQLTIDCKKKDFALKKLRNQFRNYKTGTVNNLTKLEISVLNELKKLNDTQLLDFKETRLKPYIKVLESRVEQKKIVKINGAKINR